MSSSTTNTNNLPNVSKLLLGLPKHYKLLANETVIRVAIRNCASQILTHITSLPLKEDKSVHAITLLCILKGGSFFTTDLSRDLQEMIRMQNLPISINIDFISATSYQGKHQASELTINSNLNINNLLDKHVILVDELLDNGETIHQLTKHLLNQGINENNLYSCVAFMKKKQHVIEPNWYGLLVPDVWLVGYGLDDLDKYRELPILCFVDKPEGITKTEDDKALSGDNYGEELIKFSDIFDVNTY